MKPTLLKKAILSIALLSVFNSHSQNAINFDGADDIVNSSCPGVLGSTNRTFEAWVYVSSSAPISNLAILDYGLNAVGGRNTFNVTGSRALSFISGGTNANISSSPSDVPVDQWAHVAFVLNSGTGFLYVNGSQVGTGSLTAVNTPSGNENLKIGQRVPGGSIPFYGSIDEVRIWNVAKTQVELAASMNNELCSTSSDLVAYYRLNEGIAGGTNSGVTSTIDDSGNGNNGTLSNFALSGASSNWVSGAVLTSGMSSTTIQLIECNTYTWALNSMTYTTSGVYSEVLVGANAAGCDSTISLDLTISITNDLTTNVTACDTYTWSANGNTYTSSTSVTELLTNGQGCDYLHTLNLVIGNSSSGSATITACGSYTWSANGTTYTSGGSFTETLTNAAGCDSVATLILSLNTIDNTAQDNGDGTLSANETGGGTSYQWLDCNDNYSVISGETNQIYTPSANGSYAVQVSSSACVDTSACIIVSTIGIDENFFGDFSFYPNPTDGLVTINLGSVQSSVSVSIYTIAGQLLSTFHESDTKEVQVALKGSSGMYLMKIQSDSGEIATLRILKK